MRSTKQEEERFDTQPHAPRNGMVFIWGIGWAERSTQQQHQNKIPTVLVGLAARLGVSAAVPFRARSQLSVVETAFVRTSSCRVPGTALGYNI